MPYRHLETKYYNTDLEIVITDYTIFENCGNDMKIPEKLESLLSLVEGIIFIVISILSFYRYQSYNRIKILKLMKFCIKKS